MFSKLVHKRLIRALAVAGASTAILIGGCLEQDFTTYSLQVQARGLNSSESITVSNGSTLEITGNNSLTWTDPQTFDRGHREDAPGYTVRILQQPTRVSGQRRSLSNKVCRILNPSGEASRGIGPVRIECGYQLTMAGNGIDTGNDLFVSNGFQALSLNSSLSLVSGLSHTVVQDPASSNPDAQALRLQTIDAPGMLAFSELYLPGDPVVISHSSTTQGCQIENASSDSLLSIPFPSEGSFNSTVNTIFFDVDWIAPTDSRSEGRTCAEFSSGITYYMDYAASENNTGGSTYSVGCFPLSPITINCGLALRISVNGLVTADSDEVTITAVRNEAGGGTSTHVLSVDEDSTVLLNLAFVSGESYEISTSISTLSPPKSCAFVSTGGDISSPGLVINADTTETLNCS